MQFNFKIVQVLVLQEKCTQALCSYRTPSSHLLRRRIRQTFQRRYLYDKVYTLLDRSKNYGFLLKALEMLRENDTLVVWKLDRLGRSVKSLIELVSELNSKNIHFKSLTDSIDTSTPSGRFFFHVMASLAQMERELIVERTKAGLESAKKLVPKKFSVFLFHLL